MQRLLLAALPAAMLVIATSIALTNGVHGVLGYGAVIVGVVALVFVFVGFVEAIAEFRNYRLIKRRPAALVLPSVQSDELVQAVRRLSRLEGFQIAAPPFSLSLLIDQDGVEVWAGVLSLYRYSKWPWETIRAAEFTRFRKESWRGIQLSIVAGEEVVDLPFPIFGAGPLGAYTLSERKVRDTLEELSSRIAPLT